MTNNISIRDYVASLPDKQAETTYNWNTGSAPTAKAIQVTTYSSVKSVKEAEKFLIRALNENPNFLGGPSEDYNNKAGSSSIRNKTELEQAQKRLALLNQLHLLCQNQSVTLGDLVQAMETQAAHGNQGAHNSPLQQEIERLVTDQLRVTVNRRDVEGKIIKGEYLTLDASNYKRYLDHNILDGDNSQSKQSPTELLAGAIANEVTTISKNLNEWAKTPGSSQVAHGLKEVAWTTYLFKWGAKALWVPAKSLYTHGLTGAAGTAIATSFKSIFTKAGAKSLLGIGAKLGAFSWLPWLGTRFIPGLGVALLVLDIASACIPNKKDSAIGSIVSGGTPIIKNTFGGIANFTKGLVGIA
jgi:hypothetical protein